MYVKEKQLSELDSNEKDTNAVENEKDEEAGEASENDADDDDDGEDSGNERTEKVIEPTQEKKKEKKRKQQDFVHKNVVRLHKYTEIFNSEFNYGFFKPKKDM